MAKKESPEVKKERKPVRHLLEQCEYGEWLYNNLYPVMKDNIVKLEEIFGKFVNTKEHEITEEDWNFVKDVCNKLEKTIPEESRLVSYNKDEIKSAKYKNREKHSTFYYVRTNDHARFALKMIDDSRKNDVDDKKQFKTLLWQYLTIAYHIYYFITAPEK